VPPLCSWRPRLLDAALGDDQPPVVADRVAAAAIPEAPARQRLLATLDDGQRLALVGDALDALVDDLRRRAGG
jgi:hypothetical protein